MALKSSVTSPAVDCAVGKFTVDPNGCAQYSVKIDTPQGIGHGNEPDLSIQYCQGVPNGVLGPGWMLGGLSVIQRSAATLTAAYKDNPQLYDPTIPRLSLDGQELLNISGEYWATDAKYAPTLNPAEKIITPSGSGFQILDSAGRRLEYGTTTDSVVLSSDGQTILQWYLKKSIDLHGNFVSYNYTAEPSMTTTKASTATIDPGIRYIDNVCYTSNENGYQGQRYVYFEYITRKDVVVRSQAGGVSSCAYLISTIYVSFQANSNRIDLRSYAFSYSPSSNTQSSLLTSITEASCLGDGVTLAPTVFTYTSNDNAIFQANDGQAIASNDPAISLIPMDVSGRGLTEFAVVSRSNDSNLSLETFSAGPQSQGVASETSVVWSISEQVGSLPVLTDDSGLQFLFADITGDGRTDLVLPYQDLNGSLAFSISQNIGIGFQDCNSKSTGITWNPTDNSSYMAIDLNGNGRTDVIQIFSDANQNLNIRTFMAVDQDDEAVLADPQLLTTQDLFGGTIQWLVSDSLRNGSKSLVRVWQEEKDVGQSILHLTTFAYFATSKDNMGIREVLTTDVGVFNDDDLGNMTVLCIDANGDGVQDVVLCSVEQSPESTGVSLQITLTAYLSDGLGGFLAQGFVSSTAKHLSSSRIELGKIQGTNVFGTHYTDISYVYIDDNGNLMCVAAQGASTAVFEWTEEPIKLVDAEKLPGSLFETVGVDINGTSKGGFVVYTEQGNGYVACPVYNMNQTTDLLETICDPMGLKTSITYSPLTSPAVYQSDVSWDKYQKQKGDQDYPFFGGGTYVVSRYDMINDPDRNSLQHSCSVQKAYFGARIATNGRGWEGFQQVDTLNSEVGLRTIEKFLQQWPQTGLRTSVSMVKLNSSSSETTSLFDTPGIGMQSHHTEYSSSSIQMGPWKIYRNDPTKTFTQMFDDSGQLARKYGVTYVFDDQGNMVQEMPWEAQVGDNTGEDRLIKMYSYMTLNGINLAMAKKSTTVSSNSDMSTFQSGDLLLTMYNYDTTTGIAKSSSEWSDDVNNFVVTVYARDEYGNEIGENTPAGLHRSVGFDLTTHSFPVKIEENAENIDFVAYSAFDILTGKEVVSQTANGNVKAARFDAFCRPISKRMAVSTSSSSIQSATSYLSGISLACDDTFVTHLQSILLAPLESVLYKTVAVDGTRPYLCKVSSTFAGEGADSYSTKWEVFDAIGNLRRQWESRGQGDRTLKWFEYDSQGNRIFESLPATVPSDITDEDTCEWLPSLSLGTNHTYDILRRPQSTSRPAHVADSSKMTVNYTYAAGGASITISSSNSSSGTPQVLETKSTHLRRVNDKDKVISSTDGLRLTSTFDYDPLGRLVSATDPGGKAEIRSYNTRSKLTKIDNIYQNTQYPLGIPAVSRTYDQAGHLLSQRNALNETITYVNDAKGRLLSKTGTDGKSSIFIYDSSGFESLSSVVCTTSDQIQETRFDYVYDVRGRKATTTLTLNQAGQYTTTFEYDWQDQVVQQILADGTTVRRSYIGDQVNSTAMIGPNDEEWTLTGTYSQYNAFGTPQNFRLSGSGGLDTDFDYSTQYDAIGFPSSSGIIRQGETLAMYQYAYNELDQVVTQCESISGYSLKYSYAGRRLASYNTSSGSTASYSYDSSGNMTSNAGLDLAILPSGIVGTRDGSKIVQVQYDTAGRMSTRSTSEESLSFEYDSLGNMSSINDTGSNKTTTISQDHLGKTLSKVFPDGSIQVELEGGLTITTTVGGTKSFQRRFSRGDSTICVVTTVYSGSPSKVLKSSGALSADIYLANLKGNITHVFQSDGSMKQQLSYDPFGLCTSTVVNEPLETYEGRCKDIPSGLLDFGSRWYDPLVGRFTTPDDILSTDMMLMQDGLNRNAFENNDPINHTDPTGHASWFAVLAIVVCVVAFAALLVTSGGSLGVLAYGAAMGAATSGAGYSWAHRDETSIGKFALGFAQSVAVGALVGAATAGASDWMTGASQTARIANASRWVAGVARIGENEGTVANISRVINVAGRAAINTVGNIPSTIDNNAIEDELYGAHKSLFTGLSVDDLGKTFAKNVGFTVLGDAGRGLWKTYGDKVLGKDVLEKNLNYDADEYSRVFSANSSRIASVGVVQQSEWNIVRRNPFAMFASL